MPKRPSYAQLLNTFEWHQRRDQILERDGHQCRLCGSTQSLEVHHRYYIARRMPWEYTDFALLTLCKKCHESEHEPYTFNTWECIGHDLQIDSSIAPLFACAFNERMAKAGIDNETMMAALIKSLDSDEIWEQMLEAGAELMRLKYSAYPAHGSVAST